MAAKFFHQFGEHPRDQRFGIEQFSDREDKDDDNLPSETQLTKVITYS